MDSFRFGVWLDFENDPEVSVETTRMMENAAYDKVGVAAGDGQVELNGPEGPYEGFSPVTRRKWFDAPDPRRHQNPEAVQIWSSLVKTRLSALYGSVTENHLPFTPHPPAPRWAVYHPGGGGGCAPPPAVRG